MKNQAHPIIVVKRRKAKSHGAAHGSWKIAYADFMTAMMAFFLVMWLISISSPKELIQIAEYFRTPLATAVTGGDRISNSESPIPGGGDDYTQSQGEVNKQPNIEELKKRMEQSRLRKLRGDLDQLISPIRNCGRYVPISKSIWSRKVYVFRSSIARIARCLEPAVPMSNPICATFCAPLRLY